MAIQWGGWESLGRPQETGIGRPFVQRNQDGRLEVFASGQGAIFNIAQLAPNGTWRGFWLNKGSPSPSVRVQAHVVGRNADGREEIFALGDDKAMWQKWQVQPNSGWSDWKTLGTPAPGLSITPQYTVGRNQDNRQEIFAAASDGNIWQIWQTSPNNGWSNWKQLGKPNVGLRSPDRITVGRNRDGRQELFAMGVDDALWHIWQVGPNVGWGTWQSLGKPRDNFPEPRDRDLSEPLVRENADGHLEIFSVGNGAFCNRWQEAPNSNVWRHEGWNAKPKPSVAVGLTWLEGALNFEGKIEIVGFGDDGAVWDAFQIDVPPNWSPWRSLAKPAPGIPQSERLTVGANQDGRLEAFVAGQDGALWHVAQVR